MSNDFFWELTVRNIEDALWNSLSQNAMFFGGAVVAVVANVLARSIIPDNHRNKGEMKDLICTVIGVGAGVWVSFRYADRLPHVTFAADKALKFAVISAVSGAIGLQAGLAGTAIVLITTGGALGYFGRDVLRTLGGIGAVFGSLHASSEALKQ